MIIKKPYAFLIRNFRIIHGFVLLLLLYVGKETLDIYDFFSSYVNLHSYVSSSNLAKEYVTFGMYLICALIIILSFIIYYILSLKNKDRKIYMYSILYYIGLIVYFAFMAISFNKLQGSTFSVETVRAYRDFGLIILIPQLIFIFIIFSRTLGFNLKQFEFKKDLEEMNIDVSDSEEVELNVGSNAYKYKRALRKLLRLTKYFIMENKSFVIILCSVLVFAISFLLFSKINVYKDVSFETKEFIANNITYNVKDCYITQTDLNSNIIKENKYYLLVKIELENKSTEDVKLNSESYRLKISDSNVLYPNTSVASSFIDLGSTFYSKQILSGYSDEFFVVFEIDKSYLADEYILMFENNYVINGSKYKDMIIKPISFDEVNDNGTKNGRSNISLDKSFMGNSELYYFDYSIDKKFKQNYEYKFNGKDKIGVFTIIPDTKNTDNNDIMRIESELIVDNSTYLSNYVKNASDLYNYFGFIKYISNGNEKTIKIKTKKLNFDTENYTYFEIPNDIEDASSIKLILLIRGQKYTFILK